jgi:tRNA-binding EMAP/Myf-like protein
MKCKFLEDVVTGRMAVAVVDQLEIVEVEGENSQGMTAAGGARDLRG